MMFNRRLFHQLHVTLRTFTGSIVCCFITFTAAWKTLILLLGLIRFWLRCLGRVATFTDEKQATEE